MNRLAHLFPTRIDQAELLRNLLFRSEAPPIIFLHGSKGVGKTRLIKEIIASEREHPTRRLLYFARSSYPDLVYATIARELLGQDISGARDLACAISLCSQPPDTTFVILDDAQELVEEDLLSFSALMRLHEMSGWRIGFVLVSRWPAAYFSRVGMGVDFFPVQIDLPDHSPHDIASVIDMESAGLSDGQMSPDHHRQLVQSVLQLACSSIANVDDIVALVKKCYPHARTLCRAGGHANMLLCGKTRSLVSSFLNFQDAGLFLDAIIADLNRTCRYLLLSAHIASTNLPKHDLVIFGSSKRKRRRAERSCRVGPPKAFALDRFLAIFYFIVPSPVPCHPETTSRINELVERRLLERCGRVARFQSVLSIDFVQAIAKSCGDFKIANYLY